MKKAPTHLAVRGALTAVVALVAFAAEPILAGGPVAAVAPAAPVAPVAPVAIAPPGASSSSSAGVNLAPCPATLAADMVCVAGGPFRRGIDAARARKLGGNHKFSVPEQTIQVSTFLIDKYEVTVELWRSCVAAGACNKAAGPLYEDFDAPKQPIAGISWYDAVSFCKWQGKRLPTETEWEKAARGADGRMFPWGDEPANCDRAVYKNQLGRSCGHPQRSKKNAYVGRPEVVGSRPMDPIGTFDLAGNSWEWTADWFSPSWADCGAACRGDDPKGPCGGKEPCPGHDRRVVRGGSWYWPADHMATWFRRAHLPANRPEFHHFGFRCARDP